MVFQKTLKSPVMIEGIGVHSGRTVMMQIRPAAPNHGIVFKRTDIADAPEIPARFENVGDTTMATTLDKDGVTIGTIEHLMAALQGLGVDNAFIEVNGPEIPIMDGSSIGFYEVMAGVGLEAQLQARPVLKILRRVELKINEKWAVVEPAERLEIHGTIEFDHPVIGYQEFHYREGETTFKEIAGARTFGFLNEVEALKKMGLAQGGSLDNAVVLDEAQVLNPGGLRYRDEFVRHKVLDALGDFKLSGLAIHGSFRLHRAGHDVHNLLMAEIFKDPRNYQIVDEEATSSTERPMAPLMNAIAN